MTKGQRLNYHFNVETGAGFVMLLAVRSIGLLGMIAAACGVMNVTANAQPASVEKIANYTGADRQKMLEDGARSEGAIVVYTTGTQIKPLVDRFEQKYPGLKVELVRASSADIARKVVEEYRAGYHKVDMFELATHGLVVPREENVLQPFTSPQVAAFESDAVERNHNWVVVRESYTGIGFNTKLLPADKAPKTYQDLLDPQWKGKMALSGVSTTAVNWVGTMVIVKGEDFVRKLGGQNIRVYNITGRALANLMTSGEVMLSPTIYNSHVAASKRKGAPLGWFAPGPVPVTDSAVTLARKAPHPHAAMLLIDFLMSKEAAALYQKLGYDSPRRDMPSTDAKVTNKLYLTNRPNYIHDYEGWAKLYQSVFVRRRL
jgi:iron(III) transport system substrate-binding protein